MRDPTMDRPPLANDKYKQYYWIQLKDDQISEIISILLDFEAGAVEEDSTTAHEASHYPEGGDF